MIVDGMKRDKDYIKSLFVFGKDIKIKKDIEIIYPARYQEIGMCNFGSEIEISGPFLIINESKYAINSIPGTFVVLPASIIEFVEDNVRYVKLLFTANSVFSNFVTVMKKKDTMFGMLNDFLIRGKIPEFLTVSDMLRSLGNGGKYVDDKFKGHERVNDMLTSIIFRSAVNPEIFLRTLPVGSPYAVYGLIDMKYGYNNLPSKITHNFFRRGLKDAMVSDKMIVTKQDKILGGL